MVLMWSGMYVIKHTVELPISEEEQATGGIEAPIPKFKSELKASGTSDKKSQTVDKPASNESEEEPGTPYSSEPLSGGGGGGGGSNPPPTEPTGPVSGEV